MAQSGKNSLKSPAKNYTLLETGRGGISLVYEGAKFTKKCNNAKVTHYRCSKTENVRAGDGSILRKHCKAKVVFDNITNRIKSAYLQHTCGQYPNKGIFNDDADGDNQSENDTWNGEDSGINDSNMVIPMQIKEENEDDEEGWVDESYNHDDPLICADDPTESINEDTNDQNDQDNDFELRQSEKGVYSLIYRGVKFTRNTGNDKIIYFRCATSNTSRKIKGAPHCPARVKFDLINNKILKTNLIHICDYAEHDPNEIQDHHQSWNNGHHDDGEGEDSSLMYPIVHMGGGDDEEENNDDSQMETITGDVSALDDYAGAKVTHDEFEGVPYQVIVKESGHINIIYNGAKFHKRSQNANNVYYRCHKPDKRKREEGDPMKKLCSAKLKFDLTTFKIVSAEPYHSCDQYFDPDNTAPEQPKEPKPPKKYYVSKKSLLSQSRGSPAHNYMADNGYDDVICGDPSPYNQAAKKIKVSHDDTNDQLAYEKYKLEIELKKMEKELEFQLKRRQIEKEENLEVERMKLEADERVRKYEIDMRYRNTNGTT